MTAQEIASVLEQRFAGKIGGKNLEAIDPWVSVEADSLAEIARFCRDDERLRFDSLQCISGVDYLEPDPKKVKKAGFEPHVEVLYNLYSFKHKHKIVLKVVLPRWKNDQAGQIPDVPSVAGIWRTADWHEREVYDLSGVNFVGHPNLIRILCPEDWVGYPLRKDYEFPEEYHGIRAR
jgi:NADH-quinone oxidoreductase subunit C